MFKTVATEKTAHSTELSPIYSLLQKLQDYNNKTAQKSNDNSVQNQDCEESITEDMLINQAIDLPLDLDILD